MITMRGFSLVELVVTMAVLVTVSLLAIPSFQTSIGNAQVRTVAESLHHGLQQARMEAIKRNTRIQFSFSDNSAWQLGCVNVSTDCPAIITQKSAAEGAGGSLSVSTASHQTVFNALGGRDAGAVPVLSSITLSNPTVSDNERKTLRIVLAAGGFSRICDPAVSTAGDPRAC